MSSESSLHLSETNQPKKKNNYYKSFTDNFEELLLAIGFIIMIVLITLQVITRYLLVYDLPIPNITIWSEELARYIFIGVTFLGASLAIKKRESIKIDFFTKLLPEKYRLRLRFVSSIFIIIFSLYMVFYGSTMVGSLLESSQTSPALHIPMFIPYAIIPLGFLIIIIRTIQTGIVDYKDMNRTDFILSFFLLVALTLPITWFGSDQTALVLFGYLAVFMIIGVPIVFAIGASTIGTALATGAIPIGILSQTSFTSIDSFPIMAIPFFVAAGVIMGDGDLIRRLLELSKSLVGFIPASMALVAVVTSIFFAAISGSGPATVAAVGTILIPAMVKQGYSIGFSTALIASAGAIGVIIPPSTPFIIYGVSSGTSIGHLFVAGIIPGVVSGIALGIVAFIVARRKGWDKKTQKFSAKGLVESTWNAKYALIVPVIILGGIYGGIMTPTEAAAVTALYGIIVELFFYRNLKARDITNSLIKAGPTSSIIIMLIMMATIFGRIISIEGIADSFVNAITNFSTNPIVLLIMLNLILLLIGLVVEALAAIVIFTPLLLPIALEIGLDPVHFGVLMVFNLAIGFITPPIGVNVIMAASIAKIEIEEIFKKITPFFITLIVMLAIVTYVPQFSLWLVSILE